MKTCRLWRLVLSPVRWVLLTNNCAVQNTNNTYRRLSSSFLMIHSAPVRLHWVHSVCPSGTTHRILLSRQEAHATDARCRICCLLPDWRCVCVDGEGDGQSWGVAPSDGDRRFACEVDIVFFFFKEGLLWYTNRPLPLRWWYPGEAKGIVSFSDTDR